jgi:hypothetical protein
MESRLTAIIELWLQWNTGDKTPKIGLFVGIYAFISVVSLFATGGML